MPEPDALLSAAARRAAASRAALVAAARALYAAGGSPSVTEAARAAGISRATAYRQFPSPELLAEAAVEDPEAAPIPDILAGLTAPRARALAVCDWRLSFAQTHAAALRRHLALRQQARLRPSGNGPPGLPSPSPRAEAAYRAALVAVRDRMPAQAFDDLTRALVALTGHEALAALTDRGVVPDAAVHIARGVAVTLLDGALPAGRLSANAKGPRAMPGARPPKS